MHTGWLTPLLGTGSLLLFDEFLGAEMSEARAFEEWRDASGVELLRIAEFDRDPVMGPSVGPANAVSGGRPRAVAAGPFGHSPQDRPPHRLDLSSAVIRVPTHAGRQASRPATEASTVQQFSFCRGRHGFTPMVIASCTPAGGRPAVAENPGHRPMSSRGAPRGGDPVGAAFRAGHQCAPRHDIGRWSSGPPAANQERLSAV